MYIPTNVSGLVKDSKTGAILSVDKGNLEAYRKQKKNQGINKSMEQKISKLESDMEEIKKLLNMLIIRKE